MDYVCMATLRFRHIRKVAREKKFRKPAQTGTKQPILFWRRKTWSTWKQQNTIKNSGSILMAQNHCTVSILMFLHAEQQATKLYQVFVLAFFEAHTLFIPHIIFIFLLCTVQWWLQSESRRMFWQIPLENWRNFTHIDTHCNNSPQWRCR